MTLSGNTTLLSWGDTGARGQTSRAGGEPDQQRTEKEQRQPRQKGSTDTQTGVRDPTDTEEQQRQDRRPRAATSQGSLTGRADQTGSAAPAGLAGRLHQQQPQRNPAQRREQQNTHQLHPITSPTPAGAGPPQRQPNRQQQQQQPPQQLPTRQQQWGRRNTTPKNGDAADERVPAQRGQQPRQEHETSHRHPTLWNRPLRAAPHYGHGHVSMLASGAGLGAGYYSMEEFEMVYGADKAAVEAWQDAVPMENKAPEAEWAEAQRACTLAVVLIARCAKWRRANPPGRC